MVRSWFFILEFCEWVSIMEFVGSGVEGKGAEVGFKLHKKGE